MTKASAMVMYASVIFTETARTAITALNDLKVKSADIFNEYTQAPVNWFWTVLCPELGDDVSKTTVIVRALYALKSAGAAFRSHFAKLGYGNPYMYLGTKLHRTR